MLPKHIDAVAIAAILLIMLVARSVPFSPRARVLTPIRSEMRLTRTQLIAARTNVRTNVRTLVYNTFHRCR